MCSSFLLSLKKEGVSGLRNRKRVIRASRYGEQRLKISRRCLEQSNFLRPWFVGLRFFKVVRVEFLADIAGRGSRLERGGGGGGWQMERVKKYWFWGAEFSGMLKGRRKLKWEKLAIAEEIVGRGSGQKFLSRWSFPFDLFHLPGSSEPELWESGPGSPLFLPGKGKIPL